MESHRASWFKWQERHISLIHIQKHIPITWYVRKFWGKTCHGLACSPRPESKTFPLSSLEDQLINVVPYPSWDYRTARVPVSERSMWAPNLRTFVRGLAATRRRLWSKVRNAKFYVLGMKKEAELDSGFSYGDPVSQRLTKSPFWIVYRITWKSPSQNASSDCRDRNRNSSV